MFDWMSFMPSDVEPLSKNRKRVDERDAAGLCLAKVKDMKTGKMIDCPNEARCRGRCAYHNRKLRDKVLETPKAERLAYLNNLVRLGQLMPDRQGQHVRKRREQSKVSA